MSDDRELVEHIRALLASQQEHPAIAEQCLREAAATIERLLAEVIDLEAARLFGGGWFNAGPDVQEYYRSRARQALQDTPS